MLGFFYMGLEGGKKETINKVAKGAAQAATLALAMLADESAAGKREAAIRAFESKKITMQEAVAEDTPKDDPKEPSVKWRIQE